MLKTHDFALDTKSIEDNGQVEGLAVGYGNLDRGGDIVLPGAITASIAGKSALPMLMFHDQRRPAGVWNRFTETSEGLLVKGRFAMSTTAGREAHGLVKDGALGGLSMGFIAVKERRVGKANHIVEAALHEISLCTIPMNEKTLITGFKAMLDDGKMPSIREFEEFLRDAGGFSKTLAAAIAGKAAPHLRGEPEAKAKDPADFLRALLASG